MLVDSLHSGELTLLCLDVPLAGAVVWHHSFRHALWCLNVGQTDWGSALWGGTAARTVICQSTLKLCLRKEQQLMADSFIGAIRSWQ